MRRGEGVAYCRVRSRTAFEKGLPRPGEGERKGRGEGREGKGREGEGKRQQSRAEQSSAVRLLTVLRTYGPCQINCAGPVLSCFWRNVTEVLRILEVVLGCPGLSWLSWLSWLC